MTLHDRRGPRWRLLAAAALATAGCVRNEPLDMKVRAGSPTAYSTWLTQAHGSLSPGRMRDLDEAIEEIRLKVSAEGKASGTDAVEGATLAAIDGRTVRDVLQFGLGWELFRLDAERGQLDHSMRDSAWTRIQKGDTDAGGPLYDLRRSQEARLKAAMDQIADLREKLASLSLPASTPAAEAVEQPPPVQRTTPTPVPVRPPSDAAPQRN
jgi:hypothetical protein